MKKLDLTNGRDLQYFVENYHLCKDAVELPQTVLTKFDKLFAQYDDMILTNSEVKNQMVDILKRFLDDLDVKVTWDNS